MSSAPQVFNAAYINALRQGNPATETHFVNHFSPILLRKLRRNLRMQHLAEDLQQETFLRVLTAIRFGRGILKPERFEVYVLGVCKHVLHEHWRKQRQAVALESLEDIDVPGDSPSAYALVLAQETKNEVQKVLSRLGESGQGILQSLLIDERNKEDICRHYGVNRSYLRVLLYRAKKEFARQAGKNLPPAVQRLPARIQQVDKNQCATPTALAALLTRAVALATGAA